LIHVLAIETQCDIMLDKKAGFSLLAKGAAGFFGFSGGFFT